MYPTAATIEAAEEPTRLTPDIDVLGHLCDAADRIQKLAADCVAVSFAYAHDDVTLTLVASGEEQQSLLNSDLNEVSSFSEGAFDDSGASTTGGCPVTKRVQGPVDGVDNTAVHPCDEHAWWLQSQHDAYPGIVATVTLPVLNRDDVVGCAHLYGSSPNCFTGVVPELAPLFGADATHAVTNADLSFDTRAASRATADRLRSQARIDIALGIIASAEHVSIESAAVQLRRAAGAIDLSVEEMAAALVARHHQRGWW